MPPRLSTGFGTPSKSEFDAHPLNTCGRQLLRCVLCASGRTHGLEALFCDTLLAVVSVISVLPFPFLPFLLFPFVAKPHTVYPAFFAVSPEACQTTLMWGYASRFFFNDPCTYWSSLAWAGLANVKNSSFLQGLVGVADVKALAPVYTLVSS